MKAFLTSILLVAGVALAIGSNQMTPGPVPPKRVESNGGITVRYDGGAYGLYVDGGACAGAGVSGPLCVSGPGGPSTLDAGMTLTDGDLTVNGHSSPNTGVIWLNLAHTKYIWFDGTLVQIGGVTNFSSVLNSSVTSGNVSVQLLTGAKSCLGTSGLDCWIGTGTAITTTEKVDGLAFTQIGDETTGIYFGGVGSGNISLYSSNVQQIILAPSLTTLRNNVTALIGITYTLKTLSTCSSALEGRLESDALSGVATGKRTKLCLCTSSGASVYVWQNLATGTLGTTTTCGTE